MRDVIDNVIGCTVCGRPLGPDRVPVNDAVCCSDVCADIEVADNARDQAEYEGELWRERNAFVRRER